METIRHDYAPKGVQFYYIYKALAHPETNGYVTPFTLEERLMHVQEARRRLGSQFTWLCDNMDNDLKHALGDAPNSEFVVDPDGKIVRRRAWSDPEQLRKDLAELVGAVEPATTIEQLGLKTIPPPKVAPTGIVPRVRVPGPMRPLVVQPQESNTPFYVKLRAEVENSVLQNGQGKMYLGFHLDPIYHVHWNNLVKPVEYELTMPEGASASQPKGTGPEVKEPADADPREFLIDVERSGATEPMELEVRYFACNDEEGWCKPVTQRYLIFWEVDRDGGWASGRARARPQPAGRPQARRPGAGRPQPGAGRPPARAAQMIARFRAADQNGNGKVERDEAVGPLQANFDRLDTNQDGAIDRSEMRAAMERMRAGVPRPGPGR